MNRTNISSSSKYWPHSAKSTNDIPMIYMSEKGEGKEN